MSRTALAVCLAVAVLVIQVHAGVLDADRIRTLHTYGYQHDCSWTAYQELAELADGTGGGTRNFFHLVDNPDSTRRSGSAWKSG